MKEYKDLIKEMYDRIIDFVHQHPDIEKEVFERQKEFICLSFDDQNIGRLFFDWFIFDYQLKQHGKRLFNVFLEDVKGKIPEDLYKIYSRLGQDHFGIFKVKAVKIGKELLCEDPVSFQEYHVVDSQASRIAAKGDYMVGRLLPFDNYFVVASDGLFYPKQDYDTIGLFLNNAPRIQGRLDAFELYKTIYPERIPEQLSVEEKFTLLCKEGGLSDYDIEDIFFEMRAAIKDEKTSTEVMEGVLDEIKLPEWVALEEFGESFVDVWNQFVAEIHKGTEKGPMEKTLLSACMSEIEHKFSQPASYLSLKEERVFSQKIQRWVDEWFITPREELNGKTPKEVIMEERKKLGNPQEEFGFSFKLKKIYADLKEKKAEQLCDDAAEQMNAGEYQKALELYQEYSELWDEDPVVWHNMGVCYVFLLQKRKAEKCFERALMLDPEYDLACDKLEQLKSMYKEDMVVMVQELKRRKKS